jgi:hypothetical protein
MNTELRSTGVEPGGVVGKTVGFVVVIGNGEGVDEDRAVVRSTALAVVRAIALVVVVAVVGVVIGEVVGASALAVVAVMSDGVPGPVVRDIGLRV